MADEPRTARRRRVARTPKPDDTKGSFDNVEFLESSLEDPANVLRMKLKQLTQLPVGTRVRRVLVMFDVVTDAGERGIDINWNESRDEPFYAVQDSLVSILTRAQQVISGAGGDD